MVWQVTEIQVAEPAPDDPIDAFSDPLLPAEVAIKAGLHLKTTFPSHALCPLEARIGTKKAAFSALSTAVAD